MIRLRGLAALIGSGILSIALIGLLTQRADGLKKKTPFPPEPQPAGSAAGFSSVKIIEDSDLRRFINVARDCIKDREYDQAIEALQAVLNQKNDAYVQVIERDPADPKKEITRWASVRFEANNLLGSMPADGLQAYEKKHGAEARKMLDAATKKDDRELLAEVAQRYRHTKAGGEAHELRLKQFKASTAAEVVNVRDWRSWRGNVTNTGQAVGSAPLLDKPLWSRPIMMDKLDGFPDQDQDQAAEARVKAAIKQVSEANQAVLPGFFPVAANGVMVYRNHRGVCAVALKDIAIKDEESGTSTKIKAGQILWKSIPQNRSLAVLLEKNNIRAKVDQWMDGIGQMQGYNAVPGFSSFLYDNTLLGTMVTDGRHVYMINDLAVPPHPGVFMQNQFNPQFNQMNPGDVKSLMIQNELYAYDLITGKFVWDLNHDDPLFKDSHFISLPISIGGKLYVLNERLINPNAAAPNPFGGGVVNPFGGESELRLICIDPTKLRQVNSNIKPTILEPIQVLGNVVQQNRFVQDISRRVNAVQLAYSEGVLVCPTNAGEVFGIDLMTRILVWSYPYRETPHQQIMLPGMNPNFGFPQPKPGVTTTTLVSKWKSSPPAIQAGKVVFTAPDADSIHCINLKDGKQAWKRGQKKGDLYMAGVFDGRVLIVSETDIRALDLKDGSQVWSIATNDLPSGQGVASKGMYYLPLKKSEILAVDIAKGAVKAHNRAAAGTPAPGNLVFYENMVLSQSPTEVVAYSQLSAKLNDAMRDAAKDPDSIAKLTEYGDLLLKDGQVQLGVETLLKVHVNKPADPLGKRVHERLFDGLTELLQLDFSRAAKDHLTVYKALCDVPGNEKEEQARKAKFFRLVGQGREAEGNAVEAFQMYKDFGALSIHRESGGYAFTGKPDEKIPINVWLRGRIGGLLASAKPDQRAALEAKIAEEWKAVAAKKDLDEARSFVGMFDTPLKVGRDARIRLAEMIAEKNDQRSFLEAELLLHQVLDSGHRADPQTGGGPAVLAHLEERRGTVESMRQALAYYKELARDFAKDPVRGTKTGADLLADLATDKRYQAYLDDPVSPFAGAKIAARELGAGAFNVGLAGFTFTQLGDPTLFSSHYRLLLDPNDTINPTVKLRDFSTNEDRWQTNLGNVSMNRQLLNHLYQQVGANQAYHPNARFRFHHAKGRLIVCQVGVMVYGLDGGSGKKLWEMETVEPIPQNGQVFLNQVINDQGDGTPMFIYHNNLNGQRTTVSLGRIGTVQASYVAVLGHKGLSVVDPLRGTALWNKPDISAGSHVFGDAQHVFVAEGSVSAGFGAGRTFRASDGELVKAADFGKIYQSRIRAAGGKILAAQTADAILTIRLYDILTGKDIWSKAFAAGSSILNTEDSSITGVIEPDGKLTVLEANSGTVLINSSLVVGRITAADVKDLHEPLLLQDDARYYVALNRPVDPKKVGGGMVNVNLGNGTRCLSVNGWVAAIHRIDGKKNSAAWKKGDFAWHSYTTIQNQMIVLEHFESAPILLFTARYNELLPNGGNRWVSVTHSLHKATGKLLYDSGPRAINGASAYFSQLQMDQKTRTINLVGFSGSVQHYIDDGKGAPPRP